MLGDVNRILVVDVEERRSNQFRRPDFQQAAHLVEHLHEFGSDLLRPITQALVLMALGDAMLGAPLAAALGLPSISARAVATALVEHAKAAAGVS